MLKGITVEEYGRVMKREGFDDGKAEGEKIGEARGRSEGLEQGRTEGLAEGEASGRAERELEMAKALKGKGVAIEIIAETSGLSKEEIEKL